VQKDVVEQLGQPAPEASCHGSYNGDGPAGCRLL